MLINLELVREFVKESDADMGRFANEGKLKGGIIIIIMCCYLYHHY